MSSAPEKLEELWTEKEVAEKFGLTIGKTGRSPQLGRWIAKGLPYIMVSGRRLFYEKDVVWFLYGLRKERKLETS
ncbi:hypothetical protein ACFL1I_08535 [Candidatus Omnitrophota bacterium]